MNLSIVIVNRNRSFHIVRKTLNSIVTQLNEQVELTLVDYGSDLTYQQSLKEIIDNDYHHVHLILCPTQGQLFHKTRAINMVLRECNSTYFMVLDMDCIVHPNFIEKATRLASNNVVYNFPYGFLKEEETKERKDFDAYCIDFIGGLTGTAIFNTRVLQDLNGFDEFYHNWGAEDADMFDRLERIGIKVNLFKEETLLLHQWHEKSYRDTESKQPFHSSLEKINHEYYTLSRKRNTTKVNIDNTWGMNCDGKAYEKLDFSGEVWSFENYEQEVRGLCASLIGTPLKDLIIIKINEVSKSFRKEIKELLKKKPKPILHLDRVNDMIIELIILHYRNAPYFYEYDRKKGTITLIINGDLK